MVDRFVFAILVVVSLAWWQPQVGAMNGFLSLQTLADAGVALIFLFYGMRLGPEKLKAGLANLRLHVLTQSGTFLLFPLLVWPFYAHFREGEQGTLWLGIFFLASLPSTVSSSVVMVSIAGGNIPAAIFNASLSALLGVFITPLWMLSVGSQGESLELAMVVLKLSVQVLFPVGVGMLLHFRLGAWAERHKGKLRMSDQVVILLIIYTAFCDSFASGLFAGFAWSFLLLLACGMVALFGLVFALLGTAGRLAGLERGDRITLLFCGSKKSLVHGTVMAKVLFAGMGNMGLLLMPLMLYHALQIALCSVVARRMAIKE